MPTMRRLLFTSVLLVLALLNVAPGGGFGGGHSKMNDEDALMAFIALIAFIIGGVLLYFLFKRLLIKYDVWPTTQTLQSNYDQSIKIRHGLPAIIVPSFIGLMFLGVGVVFVTTSSFIFLIFPLIGIYLLYKSVKLCTESITLDKNNIILSKTFSTKIIPIKNILSITLNVGASGRGLAQNYIEILAAIQTKDSRSYTLLCDSFISADQVILFIRHWIPDVRVEETEGFKSARKSFDFYNKPIDIFRFFKKKKD